MKYIIAVLLSAILIGLKTQSPAQINNMESVVSTQPTESVEQPPRNSDHPTKPVEPEIKQVEQTKPTEPQQEQSKPVAQEPITPKQLAQRKAAERGWVDGEWEALVELWQNESGWNPNAVNKWSGACGIPQSLPCSKIPDPGSVDSQIEWGLNYIQQRYGSPSKALYFWHHNAPAYNGSNWY